MYQTLLRSLFYLLGACLLQGCQALKQEEGFTPIINFATPQEKISQLPSAFPPLSTEERSQEWGKELILGEAFAEEWDLYRAITCYKRALILIPPSNKERILQLNYDIVFAYYLGNKYKEAINVFEGTELTYVNALFPAYNNLLILLYDCYRVTHQEEKASCLLNAIEKYSPETADDLTLYTDLKAGLLDAVQADIEKRADKDCIQITLEQYYRFAKSPQKARTLNALLPGLGYYYVGQKKAALTSFLVNALFTAAAYQFFSRGYPAAGAITASLEYGWYYGGINGAGIAANEYNQVLYDGVGRKILTESNSFPVLIFETSF